jgi:hypothetical protein
MQLLGGDQMKAKTAIRNVRDGKFEFYEDIRLGVNRIRYQTGTGKWKDKQIMITDPNGYLTLTKFQPLLQNVNPKGTDPYGFWENPEDTQGFAACDRCKGGEPNPSHRTWQNGRITLCEAHYEEEIEARREAIK